MRPFDFIITFFSFIFALGLAHLLLAFAHMIRHRRSIVFSLPHALWMLAAMASLMANWLSLWDFHSFPAVGLGPIVSGFVFSVIQYLICALVTPDLNGDEWKDLRAFQDKQGKSYMTAFAILESLAVAANLFVSQDMGIASWAG